MEEPRINCPCGKGNLNIIFYMIEKDKLIKCENCNFYQHKNCINPLNKSYPYLCPICQLSLFDPYLKIKFHFEIPSIIINKTQGNFSYKFNIKDEIFNMNPPFKGDFLVLRCLKLTEDGFCIEWPDKIELYLNKNEKMIYSVNQKGDKFKRQINEQITFPFFNGQSKENHFNRFPGKVNDFFNLNGENEIRIKFKSGEDNYNKYIISLDYIHYNNNINDIIKDVKFIENKEELKNLTKNKSDIMEEKIEFIDPISGTDIIEIPARGWKCNHLSCFDLKNYFLMQNESSRFCCPLCNKKVGQIYIDGNILKIIENYKDTYHAIQINYDYDIIQLFVKKKNIENIKQKIVNEDEGKNENNGIINLSDSEKNYEDDEKEEDNSME